MPSIATMLRRVHYIPADEIPTFKDVKAQSESTEEPIEIFLEWKKIVEFVIANKSPKCPDFLTSIRNHCCQGSNSSE